MPDLNAHAVSSWLVELRPKANADDWPPPIRAIEAAAPGQIVALGAALDEAAKKDLHGLAAALREAPLCGDLHAILAQFGAARMLRLLHWFAEVDTPDCHEVVAALIAGDGAAARSIRAAVEAAIRQAALRRIFAADRIAELETACQTTFTEAA